MSTHTAPTATYAELAAAMPTRELLRQSNTHRITCQCDRCLAIWAELHARTKADAVAVFHAAQAIAETDRLNGVRP
jgi:hypothetical protein